MLGGEVAVALDTGRATPTILVGAPVRDRAGRVTAGLFFHIDPTFELTRVTEPGSVGTTGETYAFDGRGRLLTESRFDSALEQAGLLASGQPSILSVELRDPGGDLTAGFRTRVPRGRQPFTRMAASAIDGHSGLDLDGYRDYRGVPVLGAWVWDSTLGLGLATEIH